MSLTLQHGRPENMTERLKKEQKVFQNGHIRTSAHCRIGLPVEKTFSLKKEEQYGTYVSLFPMGETVEGLTLKGFKYPLDHYQLKDREGLGVSNEITADVADVSWEQGVLLMIQSKD